MSNTKDNYNIDPEIIKRYWSTPPTPEERKQLQKMANGFYGEKIQCDKCVYDRLNGSCQNIRTKTHTHGSMCNGSPDPLSQAILKIYRETCIQK